MAYDYHGSWESVTGLNAPLFARPDDTLDFAVLNLNYSATYWATMGMPRNKIVIGIPAYGRGWKLANPAVSGVNAPTNGPSPSYQYTREEGLAAYYEVINVMYSICVRDFSEINFV
jgi:chitinase